jgi:hypothetical protein
MKVEFLEGVQKAGMKIPIWAPGKIQKGFMWGYSRREKSTILGRVLGISEIFRGGKGLEITNPKKYI